MKLPRRNFLHLAAGAAALPAVSRIAWAQAYPSRPVRIIVGFAPGGATDTMARLMGQSLSERLGQQSVIENRPGAASNVGTEAVVNAAPDGYTLLVVTSVNAINATLYEKLNFNLIRDVAPVASTHREPFVMEANPSVLVKTVAEFIAHAKANPGKINMASASSRAHAQNGGIGYAPRAHMARLALSSRCSPIGGPSRSLDRWCCRALIMSERKSGGSKCRRWISARSLNASPGPRQLTPCSA
jgi:tripartite-type tricarboxylate transporter receptor subunit TctC